MEGYSHRILDILSPYFRTGWQEIKKKTQPCNKFQILDLKKDKIGLTTRSRLSAEPRQYRRYRPLTCRSGRGWSGWAKRLW